MSDPSDAWKELAAKAQPIDEYAEELTGRILWTKLTEAIDEAIEQCEWTYDPIYHGKEIALRWVRDELLKLKEPE